MHRILVLNGPNLNLLGSREPDIYGRETLGEIEQRLRSMGAGLGVEVLTFQSNAEHLLIERVHQARTDGVAWILVNPGALAHTSIALRDAFAAIAIPFTEIHLSNTLSREPFRHHSHLAALATGVVMGLGPIGYELALQAAVRRLG